MPKKLTSKPNLSVLADKWPSAIVSRTEVYNFTGGLISPGYLANLDSLGKGPERVLIGRKTAYNVNQFILWLEQRISVA